MIRMLNTIWRYRFFIFSSIKNEFQLRFVRSRLGGMWMILHPLSQVIIFAFILSTIMSAKLPGIQNQYAYSIYLMAGILSWSLFAEILTRSVSLFNDNGNLIKKIAFPKIALSLIVVGSALVNNFLLFVAILVIFGLLGHWPGAAILWLPILTILNISLASGIGLSLGILNVFIRDIGHIVPMAMQVLFWLTPIVYMINIIPITYRHLFALNPLTYIVTGYQNILLYNHSPNWHGLLIMIIIAAIIITFALHLFHKASPEMVDQL